MITAEFLAGPPPTTIESYIALPFPGNCPCGTTAFNLYPRRHALLNIWCIFMTVYARRTEPGASWLKRLR